jgi:hypothetical protein
VDYQGHPGVITEMNIFLLIKQIDPTIIRSHEEKIKCLEAENKTLSEQEIDGRPYVPAPGFDLTSRI